MPPTAAGFGRGGKEAGEGRAGASGSREWPWPASRQQEAGTYPAAAGRAAAGRAELNETQQPASPCP